MQEPISLDEKLEQFTAPIFRKTNKSILTTLPDELKQKTSG